MAAFLFTIVAILLVLTFLGYVVYGLLSWSTSDRLTIFRQYLFLGVNTLIRSFICWIFYLLATTWIANQSDLILYDDLLSVLNFLTRDPDSSQDIVDLISSFESWDVELRRYAVGGVSAVLWLIIILPAVFSISEIQDAILLKKQVSSLEEKTSYLKHFLGEKIFELEGQIINAGHENRDGIYVNRDIILEMRDRLNHDLRCIYRLIDEFDSPSIYEAANSEQDAEFKSDEEPEADEFKDIGVSLDDQSESGDIDSTEVNPDDQSEL